MTRAKYPRRGFTIMELMVSMGLAAFLMAMSATMFMSGGQGAAFRQTVSDVASLISTVRDASSSVPAALVFDPEAGTVHALTSRNVQELHFEPFPADAENPTAIEVAQGIRGYVVTRMDGEILPQGGRVAGGLRLTQGQTVDCGNYSPYDVTDGLHVEIWAKSDERLAGTLVDKGNAIRISLPTAGRLSVRLFVDDPGGPEEITRDVTFPVVRPGEWLGIHVTYDRRLLTVHTDHGYGPILRGTPLAETRPLRPDVDAPLTLGGGTFNGVIDDFVFAGVHASEPIRMPRDVTLLGEPRTLKFDLGRLDETAHQTAVKVAFQYLREQATLTIGRSGMVQTKEFALVGSDEPPPDAPSEGLEKEE